MSEVVEEYIKEREQRAPKEKVDVIYGSDIEPREVEWLWYPYIPAGKITIIQGDPGEGKSTFALALSAIMSTGAPMPLSEEQRAPANVIYQNTEDDLADTVVPRFLKYGGDPSRLIIINEKERALNFSDDRIARAIKEHEAKLIVFDPLSSYLGGDVSMNLANEVRERFNEIIRVAQETRCAIIIVSHMNKEEGAKAIYRTSGSVDVIGAARSGLAIAAYPSDPTLKVMSVYKANLAEKGKSILFSVGESVEWLDKIDLSADTLLGYSALAEGGEKQTKVDWAKTFLLDSLREGALARGELARRAEKSGVGWRTVQRAKSLLPIECFKGKEASRCGSCVTKSAAGSTTPPKADRGSGKTLARKCFSGSPGGTPGPRPIGDRCSGLPLQRR